MLIYRVEKRNGEGPWATKSQGEGKGYVWHSQASHCFPDQVGASFPSTYYDHPRKNDFLYAFPTARAMFRYVKSPLASFDSIFAYFKKMESGGLFVVIYEVFDDTVIISDGNQCVFLPDKATLIKRLKPTSPTIRKLLTEYCGKGRPKARWQ